MAAEMESGALRVFRPGFHPVSMEQKEKKTALCGLFLYVELSNDRTVGSSLVGRTPFKTIKYRFEWRSRIESYARTRRFLI